ncbi:YpiB family protein [Terrilactibacillus laevilacticus]|uniref:YpiB family protein n=1 Tax=Terrilactibacillus laevilacticus TaxID=1380157 RepID=A0ABW5PRZ8_9BACI|nr:YpiB family protein [Terrilactibacillus laevilacticus]
MEQLISLEKKRKFLKWLIERRQLRSRETVWLLNYVMDEDDLLKIFRFVDNVQGLTRSIILSEKWTSSYPFVYIKHKVRTYDPERAFHDIRLNQEEPIYIQVNLSSHQPTDEFLAVMEESPNVDIYIHHRYGDYVEQILSTAEVSFQKRKLDVEINKALDQFDKGKFEELSMALAELKAKYPSLI